MTPSKPLVALLAAGLVAVPVSGAAAAKAKPNTVKVSRGATTLELDSNTAAALTSLGLTVSPLKPAKATSAGIAFPVTSGRLNASTYAGTIRHTGGLRVASASTHVDLRNFRIVVDASPHLTALVGKQRIAIADLDLSGAKISKTGGKLTIANVGAKLTGTAASALDQAFGTDALKGGTPLGTATVKTRVR